MPQNPFPNYDSDYTPDDDFSQAGYDEYSQVAPRKQKTPKERKSLPPIVRGSDYQSTYMREKAKEPDSWVKPAIIGNDKNDSDSVTEVVQCSAQNSQSPNVRPVNMESKSLAPDENPVPIQSQELAISSREACEARISKSVETMKGAHTSIMADLHEAKEGKYHIDAGFDSFEQYTLSMWSIGRRQADYLTSGYEAIQALLEDAPELTDTASIMSGKQIKALTKIPKAKRAKVVKDLSSKSDLSTKAIEMEAAIITASNEAAAMTPSERLILSTNPHHELIGNDKIEPAICETCKRPL